MDFVYCVKVERVFKISLYLGSVLDMTMGICSIKRVRSVKILTTLHFTPNDGSLPEEGQGEKLCSNAVF